MNHSRIHPYTIPINHMTEMEQDEFPIEDLITHYAEQSGYDNLDFEWWGPCFKPEHRYMTNEGYPMGTKIWYVRMSLNGWIVYAFGDTFWDAAWKAHEKVLVAIANPNMKP